MADIEVKMGDIAVAKNSDSLVVSGIGSCVVIALYEPKLKIGAAAHAMLPPNSKAQNHSSTSSEAGETVDTRYVDIAIDELLKIMETQGARKGDLEAKLVGGANMFSAFMSDIGKENVTGAKEKLKKEGIKLVGESVGGTQGRSAEFSASSGIVTVKMKF